MNILMLNSEYPPLGGGQGNANKQLFDVFNRQQNMDLTVDMIAASTSASYKESYKRGQIYFLDIGKKNQNLHFQTFGDLASFTVKSFFKSVSLLRSHKYHLVVAWAGVPSGFVAFLLNIFFHVPFIVLLRGADVPFWDPRWKLLDRFILCRLSPYIWKKACRVYANSAGLKALAHKVWPDGTVGILYNGVDTEIFKPPQQSNARKSPVILSVGRLIPRKGFHDLIEALHELTYHDFELWIVGDGPERDRLTALAFDYGLTERVKFWGIQSQEQLASLYKQSDIYCLPSLNEGMSNTILEAMACGLPIVTTEVSGSSELVKDNGFLVRPGDKKALGKRLSQLLANDELRRSMGRLSRKRAETFSWENAAEQFYRAFIAAA